MPADIDELWRRVKAAALKCARSERRLDQGEAEALVRSMVARMKMTDRVSSEAVQFYAREVVSFAGEDVKGDVEREPSAR